MKNPSNNSQPQTPQSLELPEGFSTETFKTLGVIAVLVLAFINFNVVIDLMTNVFILI